MKTVDVSVGKGYNVYIERGSIDRVGELALEVVKPCTAAIITDDKVNALYADRLTASLETAGYKVVKFVFPNGEASKNAGTFINILEFLASNHLVRSDVIFALGGGVVGDLAGFSAASYLRGIRFIQIPTTLLAAVDSSVGGKTGIDLAAGKNLAGAFYQPEMVVCDPDLLKTLDRNIFCDGCAEVIKYGVISDARIFDMMREPDKLDIESIIERSVEIKRDVVVTDEKELGLRQILNYGHTFGHAVEKCSNFGISHGSAVAIGMAVMARGCEKAGICSRDYREMLEDIIKKYDLPINTDYSAERLFDALLSDKKRKSDGITLVIPKTPGECELAKVSLEKAREILSAGL
ncbi:MAG: 3-dehydroquinate synthase [Clostridia bacterium]|nr:3-dehydroquinate synthase [Clostridia bacterium]